MGFPMIQVFMIAARQVSKPIADAVLKYGKDHPVFRNKLLIPIGRGLVRFTARMRMKRLGLGEPVTHAPVSESAALDQASDFVQQLVLFSYSVGVFAGYYFYTKLTSPETVKAEDFEQYKEQQEQLYMMFQRNTSCPPESYFGTVELQKIESIVLSFISIPINIFGIHMIVRKTPKKMENLKWTIFNAHFWGFVSDVTFGILSTPYMFLPLACGFPTGFLSYTSFSVHFQTYICVVAVCQTGNSIMLLFERRHNMLISNRWKITRTSTRICFLSINYLISFFVPFILFIEPPENPEASLINYLQRVPCPTHEYFIRKIIKGLRFQLETLEQRLNAQAKRGFFGQFGLGNDKGDPPKPSSSQTPTDTADKPPAAASEKPAETLKSRFQRISSLPIDVAASLILDDEEYLIVRRGSSIGFEKFSTWASRSEKLRYRVQSSERDLSSAQRFLNEAARRVVGGGKE